MSELDVLLSERDEITEKIKKAAKEEFGAAIAGLFEAYPELENFAWLQYMHEYDDGESPWEIYTNVEVKDDYVDLRAGAKRNKDGWSYISPRQSEVTNAWKKFPDWLLVELFGDDAYVVCFPDKVESYDYYGN